MGYEIKYYYYERDEENKFNMEDKKIMSKKIGDPYEEIPLEKAAQAVFKQLARRDVWVVDVEIFEIVKKPISFKETKGGIVIKGKKFILDGEAGLTIEPEEVQEIPATPVTSYQQPHIVAPQPQQPVVHPHNLLSKKPMPIQHEVSGDPLFFVEFNPGKEIRQAAREGKFTPERNYPVYKELFNSKGVRDKYVVKDDTKTVREVSEIYFLKANIEYFANEAGFSQTSQRGDGLSWDGVVEDDAQSFNIRG